MAQNRLDLGRIVIIVVCAIAAAGDACCMPPLDGTIPELEQIIADGGMMSGTAEYGRLASGGDYPSQPVPHRAEFRVQRVHLTPSPPGHVEYRLVLQLSPVFPHKDDPVRFDSAIKVALNGITRRPGSVRVNDGPEGGIWGLTKLTKWEFTTGADGKVNGMKVVRPHPETLLGWFNAAFVHIISGDPRESVRTRRFESVVAPAASN
jgi:hypothetical protein